MILVIGCGNSLRCDDGIGPRLVQELLDSTPFQGVECIITQQLTPELADPISRADRVLFIDADQIQPPGEITIHHIAPTAIPNTMNHDLDPERLLGWSIFLYGRVPEAYLCRVGGACFDLHDGLSAVLETRLTHYREVLAQFLG
jgi:hydrogenase maturation protease